MIKRRGRFGEFLGCSGYSVKNEKGEPSCNTIINLDKQGNPAAAQGEDRHDGRVRQVRQPMILRDPSAARSSAARASRSAATRR
jgi:ssDNA-binding Zn-finger/Zn-ribbon topoisomerase 1